MSPSNPLIFIFQKPQEDKRPNTNRNNLLLAMASGSQVAKNTEQVWMVSNYDVAVILMGLDYQGPTFHLENPAVGDQDEMSFNTE